MMDTVMPETCWAYKKYNKVVGYYSSVNNRVLSCAEILIV